ncbi:MAG: glutamate--tRNA ligase [Bacteroidota bacterium]|nr:glutamate--tRNA ligase [Bacteroidota bacterium]MDP4235364.1 glutamate--tRNA ligase [Bacteroidota bacterium]
MIRVRFAPSPTGFVHVGSLRTALYNFLFARHHGGVHILRVEDTDRTRYVEGAVENLLRTMEWVGITFDEGPAHGGEYGPYTQSERTELYRKYSDQLIKNGKAYPCFCTAERLDEVRKKMQAAGQPPMYDRHCRNLTEEEIEVKMEEGIPHVVRLRVPLGETITFNDLVRGDVSFDSKTIDDQVLLKSDGFPTYHLANVVDDYLMKITHVIRGEEWLSSTPKHVLLYRAFGWEEAMPKFAHLPLLLNPDRSKLSKRQGDVAVEDFRDKGYLPDALINFVALLGWNPSATEEIYSMDDLIKSFDLEKVNKAGAVFGKEKLDWMNSEYIRMKTPDELLALVKPIAKERGIDVGDDYLKTVIRLMQERARSTFDFIDFASYFFKAPTEFDEKSKAKNWTAEAKERMAELLPQFLSIGEWTHGSIEGVVRSYAEAKSISAGKLIHPLRLAVSGVGMGPGLFEMLEVIGKDEVCKRLQYALANLS